MNIEVTKETFDLIFEDQKVVSTVEKEFLFRWDYYNKKTDQNGFVIFGHPAQVYQYFLTDINA